LPKTRRVHTSPEEEKGEVEASDVCIAYRSFTFAAAIYYECNDMATAERSS
jgi:hypothetical protein